MFVFEGYVCVSVIDGLSVRNIRLSRCACENLVKNYRKLFSAKLDNQKGVCLFVRGRTC